MKKIAGALSLMVMLLSTSAFAADRADMTATGTGKSEPLVGKVNNVLISEAPLPTDYVLGSKTAPIVIVEYASLSCPHCAQFSNVVLPELQKKYIDTGKVRYVLRQFPHNEPAFKGAMLVECVGEKNPEKYFVFTRVLFDAQTKWAFDGNFLSGLETIAGVGGVSKEEFGACVNNTKLETQILKDKKQAMDELKIEGVPYFFIDGEVYNGDRSFAAISSFIEKRLPKK